MVDPAQAQAMFDALASVGVEACDVTFIDIHGEKLKKGGFRPKQPITTLRRIASPVLRDMTARRQNFIVRPCPNGRAVLIQLDDLDAEHVERVKGAAFMTLQTSPGNYQAWVAVAPDGIPDDFARRLRKGAHADPSASGATRVAGSMNFKEKYAPAFPTVTITYAAPERIVSAPELQALGLLAPPEPRQSATGRASPIRCGLRIWPDYQREVERAKPNHDKTGPDISEADFKWCLLAISWGGSIEATAERLAQLSPKARENGEKYARRTANSAAAVVERRQGRQR